MRHCTSNLHPRQAVLAAQTKKPLGKPCGFYGSNFQQPYLLKCSQNSSLSSGERGRQRIGDSPLKHKMSCSGVKSILTWQSLFSMVATLFFRATANLSSESYHDSPGLPPTERTYAAFSFPRITANTRIFCSFIALLLSISLAAKLAQKIIYCQVFAGYVQTRIIKHYAAQISFIIIPISRQTSAAKY